MTGAKYVVIDNRKYSFAPFVFSKFIDHFDMVKLLGVPVEDVVSAGFCSFSDDGKMLASGNSFSLKKSPGPFDTSVLDELFDNDETKYLAFDKGMWCLAAVIFLPQVTHREMATMVGVSGDDILGAGFVGKDADNKLYARGSSTSLKVGAGVEGTSALQQLFAR